MTAAIVLAAGGSSRLGRPKQLLKYRGRTLVRHAAQAALDGGCGPVLVVLGAVAASECDLRPLNVRTLTNPAWSRGIGTSIRAGVRALLAEETPEAAILLACDQPRIDGGLLERLIAARRVAGTPMAACAYSATLGVPALFDAGMFPALLRLKDDEGAKRVLLEHDDEVARVDWPDGATDIDTLEDYQALTGLDNGRRG